MPRTVDHEHLVEMIRNFGEAAEILQHHLHRRLFADGDEFEVHARTHGVFRVGHGRAQLSTLFVTQALLHLGHHVGRQVVDKVRDFVGIEGFDGVDEFVAVHRLDQRFTNAVVHFDENVAVGFALDEFPHDETVVHGKGFEDPGDVGGVERLKNAAQFHGRGEAQTIFAPFVRVGVLFVSSARVFPVFIEHLLNAGERTARFVGVARRIGRGTKSFADFLIFTVLHVCLLLCRTSREKEFRGGNTCGLYGETRGFA